jgi:thimet oligopeptidase
MNARRVLLAVLLVSSLGDVHARTTPAPGDAAARAPFFTGLGDPAAFTQAMSSRFALAQRTLDRLIAVKDARTIRNTLRTYDDLAISLDSVEGPSNLVASVHPDPEMRAAAEAALKRVRTFISDLSLNRAVYDALVATDARGADAETKYYLDREIRDFRLNGVDKDEPTRARVTQLHSDLATAMNEFLQNIRRNTRTITVKSAGELAGLPADYIARHAPDAHGTISIATNDSDVRPLLTFAQNEDVRKRMFMEFTNIGFPANIDVLQKMLATRGEIARLLGYENWAAYDTVARMAGSATAASDFIDKVVAASGARAAREYDEILARKRQDVPGASAVNPWENTYYSELVRKTSYNFDAQSVRPYFSYDRVRDGMFDVTSKLYGVTFRPAKDAPVWHPSVEPYEMLEKGVVIGRFYLDMHPRSRKQGNGALISTVRAGVAGRQIPEVVLVASVPGGQAGDPGLLTHDEVRGTVFHEFGHLVHAILSGRHQWFGVTRVREGDFVEAPSQMFEEWTWDPATLATFARHYQTNEPIPAPLVQRMRRASEFGKALSVRQQMVIARLSLSLHDRDPKQVDSTALIREITNAYVPFKYVEGTHRQTTITQLANPNYSASYYTYMWSLVIAKDFFGQFDAAHLLAPAVARRYRDAVLAAGGSKPAAALVRDFLGRPFNATAWEQWLNRDPS